eukprot:5007678-Pleurochrysis_carterae.AAC.1
MVEIIEVMAAAAIMKMHDPKIAIADKLASQEGANSFALSADAHEATLHNTNDAVEVRVRAHAHTTQALELLSACLCALLCLQGNFGRLDH